MERSGRRTVAVFGSSTLKEHDPAFADIRRLGEELARRDLAVMTGGYQGAMAAASQGAREAGGHVIGVTVELFKTRGAANPWTVERVHAPDLYKRLEHLTETADAFVAVTGSIGTLTELFLAWTLISVEPTRRPLVLMGRHWRPWLDAHRAPGLVPDHLFRWVEIADGPEETAELVARALANPHPNGQSG